MSQEGFLTRLTQSLAAAGVPFMVAGSLGSSFHGHPRATNDADLIIDPTPEQLAHFLALLGNDFYVSPEVAREALRRRSMFNVIDLGEGWKADLILRKERPYSVEEFQRRRTGVLFGLPLPVASPEDVILTKLEWDKLTPSERQLRDALGVVLVQGPHLDLAYLRHWAQVLGVADRLEAILRQATEIQPSPNH